MQDRDGLIKQAGIYAKLIHGVHDDIARDRAAGSGAVGLWVYQFPPGGRFDCALLQSHMDGRLLLVAAKPVDSRG